jgi:CheY-like chemotaxis protein
LNLLSNDIKFTEKGIVVLQITLVNSDKYSSSILFTVKDSGKGINKNKLHLIFESFTQEDASTTRKYGGTGLGLTISQKIINLMGSKIQVKSILNKGSEFSFILNLKNSQTSSILNNEDNHVEIDEIETKKIVIADDEQMNRDLLIEQFKHWNPQLTIDFAIDGKELVNLVAKNSYDIILTDVRMPKLSGIDATIQIKNINPSIVIIGVSANAIDHDIKECLDAGMNDYVTKPINFNQLLIKIAKHLNLKYRVIKNETSSFNNKYFARVRDISENKQEHKETVVNLTSEIDEIIKNLTAKTDYPIAHSLLNKVIYVNDPKLLNICRTYESAVKNKSSEVQENIEVIKTYWIELLPVIL